MNYYNEHDAKTAAWLRSLILAGAIPDGHVDERSIADVHPSDLKGYTQCHFFAGIGGWSYALQLAGWPSDRPVWTGSCPCQPFSTAGKGLAQADERHLWPVFFDLIRQCRPEHVFGEQVANAIGKGWLDGVSADLEGAGYACGAAVLGAHSVGSPHIRQRLYWVAYPELQYERPAMRYAEGQTDAFGRCEAGGLADALGSRLGGRDERRPGESGKQVAQQKDGADTANHSGDRCEDVGSCGLGYTSSKGPQGHRQSGCFAIPQGREGEERHPSSAGAWSNFDLIPCADGKARRIESGLAPLAHGVPARVVRLRGYGNAVVPECAKIFIEAFLDIQK